MVVNSKESARGGGGQAGQRLRLIALDVYFDEFGQAVLGDQMIEGGDRQAQFGVPFLPFPADGAAGGGDEGVGGGGDGRVGGVDAQHRLAWRAADQGSHPHHLRIAAEQQPQQPRQPRLRLHRHHARAEAAEAGGAVADMGADVEGEIALRQEAGVEAIERRAAAGGVVDAQGARDGAGVGPCHARMSSYFASSQAAGSAAASAYQRSTRGCARTASQ